MAKWIYAFCLLAMASTCSWVAGATEEDSSKVMVRTIPELRQQAFENLDSCDQAVFMDDQYVVASVNEGGFTGRPTASGQRGHVVRVVPLLNPVKSMFIEVAERASDVKIENGILYILTSKTFEAWDLKTEKQLYIYLTRPDLSSQLHWRKVASGFVLHQGRAIISHSTLGLSVIDLSSGKFIKLLEMPTKSSAQDIALLNENEAVIAVDNDAEAAFHGIYILDLKTLQISKQINVDNVFPSSVRVLSGNRLMLNFFNAIWKFDLNTAIVAKEAKPNRRAWKFPGLYVVDMVGKVHFDDKNLYSCFKIVDEQTGAQSVKPLAFDLQNLGLQSSGH